MMVEFNDVMRVHPHHHFYLLPTHQNHLLLRIGNPSQNSELQSSITIPDERWARCFFQIFVYESYPEQNNTNNASISLGQQTTAATRIGKNQCHHQLLQIPPHIDGCASAARPSANNSTGSSTSENSRPKKAHSNGEQQCFNCGVTSTPLWRRSANDELLCNACGL
ncbi:unnamed protein product [Rhizophagus irregularis]|nr:unnamed protein product [Rhizophagus irregularis]